MNPRVIIFSAFLSPLRSGAEACSEEIAGRLKKHYDVHIICAWMNKSHPRRGVLKNGIPYTRIGFGTTFDKWLFPFLAPFEAAKHEPQLIHAVLETFAGLALHFSKLIIPSAKRLLTLQTTNRSFLKKTIMRSPHGITAISRVLIEKAKKAGRHNITRIPNGIETNVFMDARKRVQRIEGRILFVGRLEPMKGIDTLIEAFAGIAEEFPKAHVRIVGDGSLRSTLEVKESELVHSGRITFVGRAEPNRVPEEYARASIFCGLSRSEALGNVFLEAQAGGCAVIGTDVDGIPDIITAGKTGLLIPPDDVHSAMASLRSLLTDKALWKRLSEAGTKNTEEFDWDLIAKRYAHVYEELLKS